MCADKVEYTAAWGARMPPSFPIYPRANLRESAGTERDGCALRAVSFATPVDPEDVLAFYATLAGRAGYSVAPGSTGLTGTKGVGRYWVAARRDGSGMTLVDLVTSRT